MKRSEVNQIIRQARDTFSEYRWTLPPFASYPPERWAGPELKELKHSMLGWDITDFGSGDYYKVGLLLFTLRNGDLEEGDDQPYAEKLMLVREGQKTPYHFHWNKMEDIINRGGGDVVFHLYNATKGDEVLDTTDVEINKDGRKYFVKAGEDVVLKPGESMTLYPYYYHEFVVRSSTALIGEVSMCNDDNTDNRFLEPLGRFPTIEEDEPAYRLLCNEYPAADV